MSGQTSIHSVDQLFTPLSVGELAVDNRFVMAPMTRMHSPGGVPGADVAKYYARRAEGGVGLIITEGTVVEHEVSSNNVNIPRLFGEDALSGWREVVRAVHQSGGRIMAQLWHVGADRRGDDLTNPELSPVSASGILTPGSFVGEPMSETQAEELIAAFARAAADAKRVGFDGIEIHGGHGYLIDEFLWSETNLRTDRYGGSVQARVRFAREVVAACRAAVGPSFPIFFRFSQWKPVDFSARLAQTPQELEQIVVPLAEAGVDVFDCSTRRYWIPEFEGSDLGLAGWTRKLTGRLTLTVGSVGLDNSEFQTFLEGEGARNASLDRLVERFENGEFDLVAVGRALLSDPDFVAKVRDGRESELIPFEVSALDHLI